MQQHCVRAFTLGLASTPTVVPLKVWPPRTDRVGMAPPIASAEVVTSLVEATTTVFWTWTANAKGYIQYSFLCVKQTENTALRRVLCCSRPSPLFPLRCKPLSEPGAFSALTSPCAMPRPGYIGFRGGTQQHQMPCSGLQSALWTHLRLRL